MSKKLGMYRYRLMTTKPTQGAYVVKSFLTCVACLAAFYGIATLAGCRAKKVTTYINDVQQSPHIGLPQTTDSHDVIISANFKRFRLNPHYRKIRTDLESVPEVRAFAKELKDRLAIDMWEDFDIATFCIDPVTTHTTPQKIGIIATGNFKEAEQKLERLRVWLAEDVLIEPPTFEKLNLSVNESTSVEKFHTVAKITKAQSMGLDVSLDLSFAFPEPNLMVFSTSPAMLDEMLNGIYTGNSILKNPEWNARLLKANVNSQLWVIMPPLSNEARKYISLPISMEKFQGAFIDANIDQDVQLKARIVLDAAMATAISQQAQNGLTQGKAILSAMSMPNTEAVLNKLIITTEGDTLKIAITATPDEIDNFSKELKAFAEKNKDAGLPFMN